VDPTERSGQKIVLHGQLADLGVQLGDVWLILLAAVTSTEHRRCTIEQLALPGRDLVGVHIEPLGDLDDRLLALDGFKGDSGLESRRVVASRSFRHDLVLLLGLCLRAVSSPRTTKAAVRFRAATSIEQSKIPTCYIEGGGIMYRHSDTYGTLGPRLYKAFSWRSTIAILLCFLLTFGNIPVSAAVLSDQALSSIVGYGLDETAHPAEIICDESRKVLPEPESVSVESEPDVSLENYAANEANELPDKRTQEVFSETTEESANDPDFPSEKTKLTEEASTSEQATTPEQPEFASAEPEKEPSAEKPPAAAQGMILQSTAYTCGPAALATLLKMLGSGDNYYEKITHLAQTNENGTSLLGLKRSAETLGFKAQGYRKSIDDLSALGPVVAHVIIGGYHHFTVVEGISDGNVLLADSTLVAEVLAAEGAEEASVAAEYVVVPLSATDSAPGQLTPIDSVRGVSFCFSV